LAAALILATAAGVAVQVSRPLCVTFIKVRILHRMKEVGQHAGAVVLSGRGREEPAALFLAASPAGVPEGWSSP
jgi:hypothetical protein